MNDEIKKQNKLIVTYARVSTSLQEDQKTIENQISSIKEYADKNGLRIVQDYRDEGWSGDILARPSLDQLRQDARKRLWDAVLIYDPDRLARRAAWQELVKEELMELGIDVLFVTVPPARNDEDVIMYKMRGVFAEYERMKIKERFRIGKMSRVKGGAVLTTEAPYGYDYVLNAGKKGSAEYVVGHYIINEYEANNVRMMFNWVDKDGYTLRSVVRRLQELNIKPRKSKRGVWSTSTLSTLFRNMTYIGEAHYGASYATVPINPTKKDTYRKVKKSSRKMRPEDQWIKIVVPAIIEKDLFERVGLKLRNNFALLGRNKKNDYLMAGKIWCTCGQRRTGEGPQHGKHLYYRCSNRVKSFPLPPSCNEKGLNARIVDLAIWNKVSSLMTSPELLSKQVERWLNSRKNGKQNQTVNIDELKKEIIKLKDQEDRYTKAYGAGVITLDQLKEYITPLKERMVGINNQIETTQSENLQTKENQLPEINEIEAFTKKAPQALKDLNFTQKKAIVMNIVEKVVGSGENLLVSGYIPFNLNNNKNYGLFTSHRNCRVTERREKHPI
jgi:site-specific DNA recombinase